MDSFLRIPEHNAYPREKKRAVRTFCRLYLSIFVFLVFISLAVFGLMYGILLLFGNDTGREILSSYYFVYSAQVLVLHLLGLPLFWVLNLGIARDYSERKPMRFGQLMIWFLISMFVMLAGAEIAAVISDIIYMIFPVSSSGGSAINDFISGVPIWLVLLVVVIIGPIFEELMFRKIMMDRLSIYGNRLAIFVSAVSFGLYHGNIDQLIYATGIGVVLGTVYSKTRMIRYPIILHVLANFFGTVPAICSQYCANALSGLSEADPGYLALSALYSLIPAILAFIQNGLFIAGLVFFVISVVKKRFLPERRVQIRISGFTLTRAIILNGGAILFLGFSIYEIVSSLPIAW